MSILKIITRGQSFTNTTNEPIEYVNKYLNCMDAWQEQQGTLEPGQTFSHCNSGKTTFFKTQPDK